MDLTPTFKASVMAVKLRNKTLSTANKNRILRKHVRDEFSKEAKDVCNNITALKDFLLENRAAYMRFASHLKNSAQMTDEQRDLIDRESEKFVIFYTLRLAQMESDWKTSPKKQRNDHIKGVLDLLSSYLKKVQNIHLEQKRYRVQHELETYRLLKLASDKKKIPVRPYSNILNGINKENDEDDNTEMIIRNRKTNESEKILTTQNAALDDDIQKSQEENELSSEDIQVFESENIQLYHELQGLSEEVEQIEKNVVDIAKLQEIFTEKIALQKHDIDRIANAVVGATENVQDANEQIRQAIQRNGGLRVWALFFLLVMSFSLLFLHWYND